MNIITPHAPARPEHHYPLVLANEVLPEDTGGALVPGQIYAANEARFTESFYSEPLTTYIRGWRDPNNIEDTLNFIAPPVEVSRRFEYKSWLNADDFLTESDDIRAPYSAFKEVRYSSVSLTGKTDNKGLTMLVDLDNVPPVPGWENMYVSRLQLRLLRNDLRRAVTALSAAATNTAKTWDTTAGKDPDMDIRADLITATTASGIRPNRVLFGDTSWDKRAVSHRAQNTAGGFASAALAEGQLATQLGVNGVHVSRERYQSSASAKTQVVNNLVVMFYAEPGATLEDPSNLKRFVSPTVSGGRQRVFRQEVGPKLVALTVEHYSRIVVTSTLGIRQFTVS
ncbi:hypothetical protein DB346_08505 [Verrucomicrobia bacterium LW23]|nr:hypothetical protein DB346_08505 [Verrucomicrobia bacterium LW23]